jgi:hypothetical protein
MAGRGLIGDTLPVALAAAVLAAIDQVQLGRHGSTGRPGAAGEVVGRNPEGMIRVGARQLTGRGAGVRRYICLWLPPVQTAQPPWCHDL